MSARGEGTGQGKVREREGERGERVGIEGK